MILKEQTYCLDSNVLIQAWQKYYAPSICPDYWQVLNQLGNKGIIFLPEEVREEIVKTDDELANWLKDSSIPIYKTDQKVISCWQKILQKDPLHQFLVDNIKGRSLADPWVISHAMKMNATLVTKESKETALNTRRIKIPNVCDNMGVRWIDDFDFIREVNILFSCKA